MRPSNLELMHDHVRAIHRAITGSDPPEPSAPDASAAEQSAAPTIDRIAASFAELEAAARSLPSVAERVPPFSFKPPFDLIGTEREIVVELGVPGVDAESVDASLDDDRLTISGARSISAALDGRIYLHAELPRGPFRREVRLPGVIGGRAKVEIDNGIVRVRVPKTTKSPLPQA